MATYNEIRELFSNSDLVERTQVAVIVAAQTILSGTPTASQKAWAASAFSSPANTSSQVLMSVLAQNKDLSVAQMTGASDAALQSAVDAVVPALVDAAAGV